MQYLVLVMRTTSWCREDGIDVDTASQVTRVAATETQLNTTVLPAYWLRGDGVQSHDSGQLSLVQTWSRVTNRALLLAHTGSHCPAGQASYNTEDTHQYEMSKTVSQLLSSAS